MLCFGEYGFESRKVGMSRGLPMACRMGLGWNGGRSEDVKMWVGENNYDRFCLGLVPPGCKVSPRLHGKMMQSLKQYIA